MAYVPSSDVPSAYLISTDADAVLLDLLGTFVLLDGGAEEILFTKHVRQIDANVISAPTKAALTNAVELNKAMVVPLVGNIPSVKSAASESPVARLLKDIELTCDKRPSITPSRFNPKYEPIIINKSLRTGRLEMFVLSGDAKEIEALRIAVENGDEQTIEKVASNNGTISVLVWFPARPCDPIKRILHTGTAPFGRIVTALEKAKALPFLHSPFVSAANAYKEVGMLPKAVNNRASFLSRGVPPASAVNPSKAHPLRRPTASLAAALSHRSGVSSTKPSSMTSRNSKPLPATMVPTRVRVTASASSAPKAAAPSARSGSASADKKVKPNVFPVNKSVGTPTKGSTASRPPPVNKTTAAAVAKTSPSKLPESAKATPSSPDPELTIKETPTSALLQRSPQLDASAHMLDDVMPEISVSAPQELVSPDSRTPVELVVIPPTPEPAVSRSSHSSVDGLPHVPVLKAAEDKESTDRQPVLVPNDDDRRSCSDVHTTTTTSDLPFTSGRNSVEELDGHQRYPDSPRLDNREPEHNKLLQLNSTSASSFIPSSEQSINERTQLKYVSSSETVPSPVHEDSPNAGSLPTTEPLPSADSSSVLPFDTESTPSERCFPPSPTQEGGDVVPESDVPEEFKGPHVPQDVGENGLLDDLEDPPRLMKISMDTEDLKKALEAEESNIKRASEHYTEAVRKLSQQMVNDASTPFASALASSLVDGTENTRKGASSTLDGMVDESINISDNIVEEVKEAAKQMNERLMAMQNRSSLMENSENNHVVKYEQTDPIIDSLLETVANDSDRVDLALSNDGTQVHVKENGRNTGREVDEDGFRIAADSHHMRLHLPPPSATRGGRAPSVPHLSRPLFFELATVPHINGKCSIADEPSAIEYFTNIRSANYILHSEEISPFVLEGWLAGKKHWLHNDQKCRLIPTRHHSALQAFVTANAAQMEEYGLVMNSSLEHNTISLNTEDGRIDYKMIKIEL